MVSGQKYQGDKLKDASTDPRFRVDLGKFLYVLTGTRGFISRTFLYGSVPPPNDTVWRAAKKRNFTVQTYRRSTASGKEKEVDVAMATDIMEMLYTQEDDNIVFIIVTGDRDLKAPMERVLANGITVDLWSWEKSLSIDYRRLANTNPLFRVHKLDDVEPHFSYKSYVISKNHNIDPRHALVVKGISHDRKSLHTVADSVSRLMRLFYITTRSFRDKETQDLIIEFPNTPIDLILSQLEKIDFGHELCTYAQYISSSDQIAKPLDTVNRFQALSTIDDECILDVVESSLSLNPEEIDESCSTNPPTDDGETPSYEAGAADTKSEVDSSLGLDDSASLMSGGSWVDVVKRKKFKKKVSDVSCRWGVHCALGSKCKYKHTEYEIEVFQRWPKVKFQKWKSKLCKKMEKHTAEKDRKFCPFAHNNGEAWCLKCKMTGHLTENCAV